MLTDIQKRLFVPPIPRAGNMISSYSNKAIHIYTHPLKLRWTMDSKVCRKFMAIQKFLKKEVRKIH